MKSFLKRHWPLIGLVILAVTVVFFIIKAGWWVIQEPILKEVMSGEGLKLKDIHYTHDDPDDKIKWVLDATEVRFSGDRKFFSFRDFSLKIEPEERPHFELKGKKGDYSRESGKINLWGNLRGKTGNGYRIFTEHLLFMEKKGKLSTEKPVKIIGPFFSITGRGLLAELDQEVLKILDDVTTVVKEEPFFDEKK